MLTLPKFNRTVIAHRGASAYAPENTLDAFNQAHLLGAPWVEFDVMLAACGTPVVFHDDTLLRTTGQPGVVDDYPYSVLATFEAGSWFSPFATGARIPTLETVLGFMKDSGMSANVEIKPLPRQSEATVKAALAVVDRVFPQGNEGFIFSSFCVSSLRHLRALRPGARLGLLMHEVLPDWEALVAELQPVSLHFNKDILTPHLLQQAKRLKKAVLVYTVNDRVEAEGLFASGVDAVFSDYPDLLSR